MKKTVLVLGCLLAVGFSTISCDRDDNLPDTAVEVPSVTQIQRSDLPNQADHYIAAMLGDEFIYDGSFTNKNVTNPFNASQVYGGVTVTSITKTDTPNADNNAVYYVTFSNGIEYGFKESGEWAFVHGNGTTLLYSIWNFLPPAAITSIIGSGLNINGITAIDISAAVPYIYTITFQDETVKRYNQSGREVI